MEGMDSNYFPGWLRSTNPWRGKMDPDIGGHLTCGWKSSFKDCLGSGRVAGVDVLTQATLGAAVGELVLGRKLGNRALAWGALFGILPDLDVLLSPFLNTAWSLWWHRGPSHSLAVMAAAAWWLSSPLARLWKKEKVSRRRAGWFVSAAWSSHVLIDCFDVYGTAVFWPFWNERVAFNLLSVVDPLFTLPMLVAVLRLAFLRTKKEIPRRARINAAGLGLSAAYVCLAFGMKQIAAAGIHADVARRGFDFERRMLAPTAFNIFLWRAVLDRGDHFLAGYRSVFDGRDSPVRWTVYPRETGALEGYAGLREARIVRRFSGDWWIARPHAKGVWIGDMRLGEIREWDARPGMVDSRMSFAWNLLPGEPRDRLRRIRPRSRNSGEMLDRMSARMVGMREQWEAMPRLAGVPGTFPVPLEVID